MKSVGVSFSDLHRALREWWPRAVKLVGDPSDGGCKYAEISFRLTRKWDGKRWVHSVITCEESRGES